MRPDTRPHQTRLIQNPTRRYSGMAQGFATLMLLLGLWGTPTGLWAQSDPESNWAPGFGLLYGEGQTENGADLVRIGFSSRRIKEQERIGSLALIGERHENGIPFQMLDSTPAEAVTLKYQSLFFEMKRYLPIGGIFHYYWGLRGGYTRITGTVDRGGGDISTFEKDQIAPLALLALPLALENPGFLLLAFMDGTSFGLTLDIVPNRLWLDFNVAAVVLPHYRDTTLTLEDRFLVSQSVQLLLVF